MTKKKLLSDESLNLAFGYFDSNSNGFISMNELKLFFCGPNNSVKISEELMNTLIVKSDEDNDGEISKAEFKAMMRNLIK